MSANVFRNNVSARMHRVELAAVSARVAREIVNN